MNADWKSFLTRLEGYPEATHTILPPCKDEWIRKVENRLGPMPEDLLQMLRHFNGAKLFIKTGPLVSIFGVTTDLPLSPLEWAPDWFIDRFTPVWRSSGHEQDEWPLAMMNYGVLLVVNSQGIVRDWDTAEGSWATDGLPVSDRLSSLIEEGDLYLSES